MTSIRLGRMVVLLSALLSQPLYAIDGITIGLGNGTGGLNSARLALVQTLDPLGFNQFFSNVGLQLEYSVNRWEEHHNSHNAFGLLPSIRWNWYPQERWHLFVDLGVGASYHQDTQVADHQLGTHYLFEDRLGLGLRHERWELALRGYHYSNGGLRQPNDGLNLLNLEVSWLFP